MEQGTLVRSHTTCPHTTQATRGTPHTTTHPIPRTPLHGALVARRPTPAATPTTPASEAARTTLRGSCAGPLLTATGRRLLRATPLTALALVVVLASWGDLRPGLILRNKFTHGKVVWEGGRG